MTRSNYRNGIITDAEEIKTFLKDFNGEEIRDKKFEENYEKWKYTLHLGKEVYVSTDDLPKRLKPHEFFTIRPGDFVLLITREQLMMPSNVMGFISMRFKYKQKGLINVSGFHVDPGYKGRLIFSAFNAGPKDIVLREDEPLFMIFFQAMDKECNYDKELPKYLEIPSEMVENIRGRSTTLSSNANRLDKVEFYMKVIGAITVALILSLSGVALKHIFG